MLKNVFLLGAMWAFGYGGVFVQIGSVQNVLVAMDKETLNCVPVGLTMLLSAPWAVVIPKLISNYIGAKRMFVSAGFACSVGAILQMVGVWFSLNREGLGLALLILGAAVQSIGFASMNNLRFAVAYFSTAEFLPKATALVILGGALGAVIGPVLSNHTRDAIPNHTYVGNFIQVAVLWFLFGLVAVFVDFAPPPSKKTTTSAPKDGDEEKGGSNTDATTSDKEEINDENENNDFDEIMLSVEEGLAIDAKSPSSSSHFSISVLSSAGPAAAVQKARRSLTEILFKTDLWLLILAQSLSYNIMALWMMNVKSPMADHGYNDNQSTLALTYHMLGMFLPSLFSGHVISALGTWPSAFVGFAILLLGGGLFYVNGSLLMFYLGITIVGVGWNLSFVGPSAAVMSSSVIRQTEDGEHDEEEKSKVQGLNDGLMLLSIGALNISGSFIYEAIGSWDSFNAMLMGVTGLAMTITLVKIVRDCFCSRRRHSCAASSSSPLAESDIEVAAAL